MFNIHKKHNPTIISVASNRANSGFTLLFAVLVSSIMLAIGLSIFNISYKEFTLSSAARESQFAFYAADAGTECALYWDFRHGAFATSSATDITCGGITTSVGGQGYGVESIFQLDFDPLPYCSDISVTKNALTSEVEEEEEVTQNIITGGTAIGDMTLLAGITAAFDGIKPAHSSNSVGAQCDGAGNGYVGKDWGAGNPQTVAGFKAWGTTNVGFTSGGPTVNLTLFGSNSAPSSPTDGVGLGSLSFSDVEGGGSVEQFSGITQIPFRYSWLTIDDGAANGTCVFSEVEFWEETSSGGGSSTIVTSTQTIIESRGYNTCDASNPRRVERALEATY